MDGALSNEPHVNSPYHPHLAPRDISTFILQANPVPYSFSIQCQGICMPAPQTLALALLWCRWQLRVVFLFFGIAICMLLLYSNIATLFFYMLSCVVLWLLFNNLGCKVHGMCVPAFLIGPIIPIRIKGVFVVKLGFPGQELIFFWER